MAASPCSCTGHALGVLLLCYFLHFSNPITTAAAADTLRPGQSLTGNGTLVSKGGTFELGFFSPGKSRNGFLGIWFRNIPGRTVVWVANREVSLRSPASSELRISGDGHLVLLNRYKTPVWSSRSPYFTPRTPNSTRAVLLETGNLVLEGAKGDGVLWQSFDHPGDTLLPGQRFGYVDGGGSNYFSFTSWRNLRDPSPGVFTASLSTRETPQILLEWNDSLIYWTSGPWDGDVFTSVPEIMAREYSINYFSHGTTTYFTYSDHVVGGLSRMWMDISGRWMWQKWTKRTQSWEVFSFFPKDHCDVYLGCGRFGICNVRGTPFCTCPPGFRPRFAVEWELGDHTGGCVREIPLACSSQSRRTKDRFQPIPDVILQMGSTSLVARGVEECELACLDDCLCMAYSFHNECLAWRGDLLNMKQVFDADGGVQSAVVYLRLADTGLSNYRAKNRIKVVSVLCVVTGVVALLCCICGLLWRVWRHRMRQPQGQMVSPKDFLVPFRYKEIKRMTNSLSEKLGEGGFGSVYRGVLPDSSVVAGKSLKNLGRGEKQFRMEVSAMGAVNHVNILRLRGFCCEGDKRLLVYDYMPGGSLDSYLSSKSSVHLDWDKRYQIALGIARGLTYLHEKCRECIIHCDIKPENMLLDEMLCPKVADFGIAKLMGRDFSRVMTTMRGTTGYMAPEWLSGVQVTPKVDVYSFGMMLFEIISGSRNGVKFEFLLWATRNVNHHEIPNFPSNIGWDFPITEQFIRACKVACWCIQDCENDRPSMGQVVQVLEGALEMEDPLPIPRLFQRLCGDGDVLDLCSSSTSDCQLLSFEA